MNLLAKIVIWPPTLFIWCAFIVGCARFAFKFWFAPAVDRVNQDIRKLNQHLLGITSPEMFAEKHTVLTEEVKGLPSLQHAWDKYFETVLFPGASGRPVVCRATRSPAEYFSSEALFEESLAKRLDRRLLDAVPNLLTGLGILGTFAGLAAAIYVAQKGLIASDVDGAKTALAELLQGAALKFMSSVAGLFSSMAFTIAERGRMAPLSRQVEELVQHLERLTGHASAEFIADKLLSEAVQQTAQLKSFSTDLACAVGDRIETSMTPQITRIVEELGKHLEKLQSASSRTDEQLLSGVVSNFRESLQGAAGTEMKEMARTLSGTREGLDSLGGTLVQLGATLTTTHAALKDAEPVAVHLGKAAEAIDRTVASFNPVVERLSATGESLEKSADAGRSAMANLEKLASTITQAAESTVASNQAAARLWEDYRGRFEGLDVALRSTFSELEEGLGAYQQRVRDYLQELDKHLGKSTQDLAAVVSPLSEELKDLPAQVRELRSSVDRLESTVRLYAGSTPAAPLADSPR
jgi:prefoldin subunit 5